MIVVPTSIPEVIEFRPKVFGDARGYFMETFRQDVFEQAVGKVNFIQDNESMSSYGVLRGLHFQLPPYTQSKLVRVIKGRVLDVAVDIRLGSPTYGKYVAVLLDDEQKNQLWVPKGFAHGYVVLSETAIFAYKVDNYYAPEYDDGIFWKDPIINIDWQIPEDDVKLSAKDQEHPLLSAHRHFEFDKFQQSVLYTNAK